MKRSELCSARGFGNRLLRGARGRRGWVWRGRRALRDRCCKRLRSGGRGGDSGDLLVSGRDPEMFLERTKLWCRFLVQFLLDVVLILFLDYNNFPK